MTERERWEAIKRDLLEGARRLGEGVRPLVAEVNRAAAMLYPLWYLHYADDLCEPEEDVFI